jgi:TetR/AcrR family transcriptional repressor of nem operon
MGRTSDADERLMKAAQELIWEESYGSVTIDDICKRAEVKKGSFYYFFESKAALAVAALEKLWTEDWKPRMDARFSPSVEPLERIRGYLEAHYTGQCQVQKSKGKALGCPICSLGSEVSTREVDVGEKVREIFARKRKYLESAIRDAMAEGLIEACDPAQKALALNCMIEGAVNQSRIMNDAESLRNLVPLGFDLLRVKQPALTQTSALPAATATT